MPSFCIVTDSTTDLSPKQIARMDVIVLPLSFEIDGRSYQNDPEGKELSFPKFYEAMRAGKQSVTAQVNLFAFLETFERILKDGKDVLYIGFSSGLSGTYSSGAQAAEELRGSYPDRKLICVDTLCASMGEGLIVHYASKLREEGKSIDEVAAWLEENKLSLCHWFTVDDLNHLKRGGRVSAAAAYFGTVLSIKPVLHVDNEGHLIPMHKVRGRKQALEALVDQMEKTYFPDRNEVVFISHGDAVEDAEFVASLIKKRLRVKTVEINFIGPVIGSHAGPGTIALFFLGSPR